VPVPAQRPRPGAAVIPAILDADEFAGRVCIVTGAARGIGAAITEALAGLGGGVVIADLDLEGATARAARLVERGFRAEPYRLDVANGDAVRRMVEDVTARLGPPAVLVNNAGIVTVAPSHELAEEDWRRQVDVMLTWTFLASQAVAGPMLAAGRGAIVNLSSIGGFAGHPGRSAYNAAKAGIACLTQVLGVEWAARGIRVNAVAPAVTRTEMLEHVLRTLEGATKRAEYVDRTPMRRLAEPEEIAACVAFLASDKASFITGATLFIDGGWMVGAGLPAEPAA
jgi:NAD(P)-dependent dehydrogenase (short-subunit alcohol dehydrogenase family)